MSNQVSNSSDDVSFTASWQTDNFGGAQHLNGEAYGLHIPQETCTSPHTYVSQQGQNPVLFNFNQSVVELFECQTELTHNTQCLH